MREVNLNSTKAAKKSEELALNLTNKESGEKRTLKYRVEKLSGRASMEAQISLAEFAKNKQRDAIVGSLLFKGVLAGIEPLDGAPEFLAVLDEIEEDQLAPLMEALMAVATGSTVTS